MSGREVARMLGRVGIWSNTLERLPHTGAAALARSVEDAGYAALWFPEAVGSKEVFAQSALLLGATSRLAIATGIASIYARDAVAMANGGRTLAEAFPRRFVLGLGVSHAPSVGARGGRYGPPIAAMSAYLDAMDAAPLTLRDAPQVPRLLAALGPRMLGLAARRADGAHPYFMPVEHTPIARAALGAEPCLAVELACVLEADPATARRIARTYTKRYLGLANYANGLRRLGWADADLAGEGSDRLVDAVVAWGDAHAIRERVARQHAAGADHVCLQILSAAWPAPPLAELAALARVLL